MINITIEGERATAYSPFPTVFVLLVSGLSGRKLWQGSRAVTFDATGSNLRKLRFSGLDISFDDKTHTLKQLQELESLATQHQLVPEIKTTYKPRRKPFAHQAKAVALSCHRRAYAYFLEMGLGKTAIALTNAGILFLENKVTGVLVLAPKGVHRQWIKEQIPEHMDPSIPLNLIIWEKKTIELKAMNKTGLTFLSMNLDAIRTTKGFDTAARFLKLHSNKSMMVLDESHTIKNGSADRTKKAFRLGDIAAYRRIMTGTPIARNIVDVWSQFAFLDPKILGHKHMTGFRARYCIMGGWEFKQVVGQRHTEEFYQLIAPHSFRLTKAEALDLPPKIYSPRVYDMGEVTQQHYDSLKRTFMTELDNGRIMDVKNAAEALLRLQQVVCGYLPNMEDGTVTEISSERLDVLADIINQISGKIIIWARFTQDILRIGAMLKGSYGPDSYVTYYGATSNRERTDAVDRFMNGNAQFFVSNSAAGGVGLNLQGQCQNVIYYSNSFNALHRWQSEDRTHRMGTTGAVNYFDIIASKTIDREILTNLRQKKSISDLTLDQIRQAIVND